MVSLCEAGFSLVAVIKSKRRGKTDGEQEMRVAVSHQIPGFERLCPAPPGLHTRAASKPLWLFKDETNNIVLSQFACILFSFNMYLFDSPGLSCGMQNLLSFLLQSSLWHVGSSSLTRGRTQTPASGTRS